MASVTVQLSHSKLIDYLTDKNMVAAAGCLISRDEYDGRVRYLTTRQRTILDILRINYWDRLCTMIDKNTPVGNPNKLFTRMMKKQHDRTGQIIMQYLISIYVITSMLFALDHRIDRSIEYVEWEI